MARINGIALAVAAAALAIGGPASAQGAAGLMAFAGKWRFNPQLSRLERFGGAAGTNNIQRDPTFTWVFTPKNYGLQFDVYAKYPQPEPTRTMTVNPDAKPHPCGDVKPCLTTGGNHKEQTYTYWKIDDRVLARLFYEKGKVVEYSSYAVSADAKRLVIDSWSPESPEFHNFQVFDKQP